MSNNNKKTNFEKNAQIYKESTVSKDKSYIFEKMKNNESIAERTGDFTFEEGSSAEHKNIEASIKSKRTETDKIFNRYNDYI